MWKQAPQRCHHGQAGLDDDAWATLLRLSYWSKILVMEGSRWVKKVYEHGRRRLENDGRANTWCNLTRKWLRDLGLEEEWKQQAVGRGRRGRRD